MLFKIGDGGDGGFADWSGSFFACSLADVAELDGLLLLFPAFLSALLVPPNDVDSEFEVEAEAERAREAAREASFAFSNICERSLLASPCLR